MNRMRAFFAIIVALIVVLFVVAQIFLPRWLEARVGDGLASMANGAPVHVRLASFPAYRLLAGTVQRFEVRLENVLIDGLRIAELSLRADDVQVDVARMWQGDPWPLAGGGTFVVHAVVTEDALDAYVNDVLSLPGRVQADLTSDGLRLRGNVALLGNTLPIIVRGHFEPTGSSAMLFAVDAVEVQQTTLPSFMVDILKESYAVRIDLDGGPLPLRVDEIVHEAGRLIVRGRALGGPVGTPAESGPRSLPASEAYR